MHWQVKRNELGIREGQVGVYAHMFEKQIIHPPTPGAVKGKRLAGSVRILPPQGGTKVPTPRPSKEGEAFSPRPSTARDRSTSGTRASTSGADASTGRPSSVSLGGRDSTCSIPEKEAITTVAEGGGATGETPGTPTKPSHLLPGAFRMVDVGNGNDHPQSRLRYRRH